MDVSADQITSWAMAAVFGVAAGYERWKNNKVQTKAIGESEILSDAKKFQERGDLMAKMAEDYKELYRKESQDHLATRQFWHDKAGEHQVALSACQDRILELQARPDLSDILKEIKEQAAISNKILGHISELLKRIPSS